MRTHLTHVRALPWVVALLVIVASLVAAPAASAEGKQSKIGAVYTETNNPSGNKLVVFRRTATGRLRHKQTVSTGGIGGRQNQPGCGPPGGCPFLDTQDAVRVAAGGRLVFAVNAGSNTVSSFRVTSRGVKLVDQKSSGGQFPHSLTAHGGLLYVLNGNSSNISGLRYSSNGKLTPINGSTQSFSPPAPPSASCPPPLGPACGSRDIAFDNNGKLLVVTLLAANQLMTFPVDSSGKAGAGTAHPSQNPLPFALAFDPLNRLVDAELGPDPTQPGFAATYGVSNSGNVTNIDNKGSGGAAPCWVRITDDGKYVFIVNAGGGPPASVARFKLSPSGRLTRLGNVARSEFALTDETLSRDSEFLYVLAPGNLMTGANEGHIIEFKVTRRGGLKLMGTTPSNLAIGASGLDGR